MSIAKNIEISTTSNVSFEDALKQGVERVSQTVKNVQGAWVKEHKVDISNGQIINYNLVVIVTFVLEEQGTSDQSI